MNNVLELLKSLSSIPPPPSHSHSPSSPSSSPTSYPTSYPTSSPPTVGINLLSKYRIRDHQILTSPQPSPAPSPPLLTLPTFPSKHVHYPNKTPYGYANRVSVTRLFRAYTLDAGVRILTRSDSSIRSLIKHSFTVSDIAVFEELSDTSQLFATADVSGKINLTLISLAVNNQPIVTKCFAILSLPDGNEKASTRLSWHPSNPTIIFIRRKSSIWMVDLIAIGVDSSIFDATDPSWLDKEIVDYSLSQSESMIQNIDNYSDQYDDNVYLTKPFSLCLNSCPSFGDDIYNPTGDDLFLAISNGSNVVVYILHLLPNGGYDLIHYSDLPIISKCSSHCVNGCSSLSFISSIVSLSGISVLATALVSTHCSSNSIILHSLPIDIDSRKIALPGTSSYSTYQSSLSSYSHIFPLVSLKRIGAGIPSVLSTVSVDGWGSLLSYFSQDTPFSFHFHLIPPSFPPEDGTAPSTSVIDSSLHSTWRFGKVFRTEGMRKGPHTATTTAAFISREFLNNYLGTTPLTLPSKHSTSTNGIPTNEQEKDSFEVLVQDSEQAYSIYLPIVVASLDPDERLFLEQNAIVGNDSFELSEEEEGEEEEAEGEVKEEESMSNVSPPPVIDQEKPPIPPAVADTQLSTSSSVNSLFGLLNIPSDEKKQESSTIPPTSVTPPTSTTSTISTTAAVEKHSSQKSMLMNMFSSVSSSTTTTSTPTSNIVEATKETPSKSKRTSTRINASNAVNAPVAPKPVEVTASNTTGVPPTLPTNVSYLNAANKQVTSNANQLFNNSMTTNHPSPAMSNMTATGSLNPPASNLNSMMMHFFKHLSTQQHHQQPHHHQPSGMTPQPAHPFGSHLNGSTGTHLNRAGLPIDPQHFTQTVLEGTGVLLSQAMSEQKRFILLAMKRLVEEVRSTPSTSNSSAAASNVKVDVKLTAEHMQSIKDLTYSAFRETVVDSVLPAFSAAGDAMVGQLAVAMREDFITVSRALRNLKEAADAMNSNSLSSASEVSAQVSRTVSAQIAEIKGVINTNQQNQAKQFKDVSVTLHSIQQVIKEISKDMKKQREILLQLQQHVSSHPEQTLNGNNGDVSVPQTDTISNVMVQPTTSSSAIESIVASTPVVTAEPGEEIAPSIMGLFGSRN